MALPGQGGREREQPRLAIRDWSSVSSSSLGLSPGVDLTAPRYQRGAIQEVNPGCAGFPASRAPLIHHGVSSPLRLFFPFFSTARAAPFPVLAHSRESVSERELQEMRKTRHALPGSAPDETGQICARARANLYGCVRACA